MKQYETKDWSEHRPERFQYNNGWIFNWFSNMIRCYIRVNGVDYISVENYFQCGKTDSMAEIELMRQMEPFKVKKYVRTIPHIDTQKWHEIKYDHMKDGLRAKWGSLSSYKQMLLATGDSMIIEWNNWGDREWGVSIDDNKGKNILGILLMELRKEFQEQILITDRHL